MRTTDVPRLAFGAGAPYCATLTEEYWQETDWSPDSLPYTRCERLLMVIAWSMFGEKAGRPLLDLRPHIGNEPATRPEFVFLCGTLGASSFPPVHLHSSADDNRIFIMVDPEGDAISAPGEVSWVIGRV